MHKTLAYYKINAKYLSKQYECAKIDHIHKLLLNLFSPSLHLLEIGCGSGRDASFMIRNGYNILAIDGSKEMVEEAKRYHPELKDSLEVLCIPDELHFKPSSFDGVYSIATLMHLKQDAIDATFKEVYNLLKPNGKFVFSVPIQRDDIDKKNRDQQGRHFSMLSKSEWIQYCTKYKFEIAYSEVSYDGLDRDGIVWLTSVVRKGNDT
jgi:cyclopropane fatty-acyl-phospholipid synthase-like methyltransferase